MKIISGHVGIFLLAALCNAQEHDATDLAKKTQNPVSDLISIPFQNNINGTVPPAGRVINNLNIQPVVPIAISSGVNMILRNILPVNAVPVGADRTVFGFGDMVTTAFFSPSKAGSLVWGAGPVLQSRTASAPELGSGKWALGPGIVLVKMTGPWVLGGLFQQLWSFAGDANRNKINFFQTQPFVNYNLKKGWAVGYAPFWTADFTNPAGKNWTIPVGLQISRTFVLARQPMSMAAGYYYNVIHPDGQPHWQARIGYTILLPK